MAFPAGIGYNKKCKLQVARSGMKNGRRNFKVLDKNRPCATLSARGTEERAYVIWRAAVIGAPPPAQPAVPDTPPETPQQPLPRETLHNAFSAFLTNLSPKNKWLAAGVLLGIGALSGLIGLCLKGGSTDMSTAIWIAAIIIFGVVEAVTAGLPSIWFVLGSMAGLVAAVCNGPIWLQVTLFFVVSIVALAATRPLVTKLMKKDIKPTNADRVLGGSARVTERIDNDVPTGAVYIDGKTWSARSSTGEIIEPDAMVRVIRMEGVKLYVEKEA